MDIFYDYIPQPYPDTWYGAQSRSSIQETHRVGVDTGCSSTLYSYRRRRFLCWYNLNAAARVMIIYKTPITIHGTKLPAVAKYENRRLGTVLVFRAHEDYYIHRVDNTHVGITRGVRRATVAPKAVIYCDRLYTRVVSRGSDTLIIGPRDASEMTAYWVPTVELA